MLFILLDLSFTWENDRLKCETLSPRARLSYEDDSPASREYWELGRQNESESEVAQLCPTPWTVACQAPSFMRFSRQDYWSGLPFPSPGDLPNPGIKPGPPVLQADSLPSEPPGVLFMYIFTFLHRLGFMRSKAKR